MNHSRDSAVCKNLARASFAAIAIGASALSFGQQGTWTKVAVDCPEDAETALLLMDGSVLFKSFDNFYHYFKLTPKGMSYSTGTWGRAHDDIGGVLYGPTGVLIDGRVFIAGGEYLMSGTDSNTAEVYNPVTDTWKAAPDGLFGDIGDTGAEVLSDGKYLVSTRFSDQVQIFDPVANTWGVQSATTAPQGQSPISGDEEGWQLLPDGSILNTMLWGQRFLPTLNEWVLTAPLANTLVDSQFEIGATLVLYNGKVLVTGGLVGGGQTALYTPPSSLLATDDSWAVGPVIPNNYGCPDCAACVEVNGKVLFISASTEYGSGPTFNEYDPSTGNIQQITGPPTEVNDNPSYASYMLALPNGQVLVTGFDQQIWLYTPTSGPQNVWRANLSSYTLGSDGVTYTLNGTLLNGMTNGAAYNDEGEMYTNYPIVYLTNTTSGAVYFARAFNPTNLLLATGNAPAQTHFVIPSTVPAGSYLLRTAASGVSSANGLAISFGISMPASDLNEPATPGGTVSYPMPATDFFTPARTLTCKVSHGPSWVTWDGRNLVCSPPAGTLTGDYPLTLYAVDNGTPPASGSVGMFVRVAVPVLQSAKFTNTIVQAGGTAQLVVTLTQPAPMGGTKVTLSSSSPYLTVPASVTIPNGSVSASVSVHAGNPPSVISVTALAQLGKISDVAIIRIVPGGAIVPSGIR